MNFLRTQFFLLLLIVPHFLAATEFKDLNEADRAKIHAYDAVAVTFEAKDYQKAPWPIVKIFKLIKAPPLTAISIFGALDYQEKYIPKTKKSKPIKHISPTEVLTEYEMELPFPLPNATHVHGSVLKKIDNSSYELSWYRVSSNSTEEAKGFARFSAFNQDTLMEYQTFIIPKSIFGPLLKKIMIKDVTSTVVAIANHIEKLHETKDPLIEKYTEYTLKSLQGTAVYENYIKSSK